MFCFRKRKCDMVSILCIGLNISLSLSLWCYAVGASADRSVCSAKAQQGAKGGTANSPIDRRNVLGSSMICTRVFVVFGPEAAGVT